MSETHLKLFFFWFELIEFDGWMQREREKRNIWKIEVKFLDFLSVRFEARFRECIQYPASLFYSLLNNKNKVMCRKRAINHVLSLSSRVVCRVNRHRPLMQCQQNNSPKPIEILFSIEIECNYH